MLPTNSWRNGGGPAGGQHGNRTPSLRTSSQTWPWLCAKGPSMTPRIPSCRPRSDISSALPRCRTVYSCYLSSSSGKHSTIILPPPPPSDLSGCTLVMRYSQTSTSSFTGNILPSWPCGTRQYSLAWPMNSRVAIWYAAT